MGTLVRFFAAGGLAVVLYYGALYALTEWAGLWYVASSAIAWALDLAVKYTLQKRWAFRNFDAATANRQLAQYIAMAIAFLLVGSALTVLLVEVFGVWYMTAQLILGVVFSAVSFLLCRRIFALQAP